MITPTISTWHLHPEASYLNCFLFQELTCQFSPCLCCMHSLTCSLYRTRPGSFGRDSRVGAVFKTHSLILLFASAIQGGKGFRNFPQSRKPSPLFCWAHKHSLWEPLLVNDCKAGEQAVPWQGKSDLRPQGKHTWFSTTLDHLDAVLPLPWPCLVSSLQSPSNHRDMLSVL